jgi:hypothetical protein
MTARITAQPHPYNRATTYRFHGPCSVDLQIGMCFVTEKGLGEYPFSKMWTIKAIGPDVLVLKDRNCESHCILLTIPVHEFLDANPAYSEY